MNTEVKGKSSRQGRKKPTRSSSSFKVFVGGLPCEASEGQLLEYFRKYGPVEECKTKKWKADASKCKGFALLSIKDRQTYDRILQAPHSWAGRAIECKKAITDKRALMRHNQKIVALKVFITGLPVSTTDQDLLDYFKQFGPIEMAYVVKKSERKTRIGFVCFKQQKSKDQVLSTDNHRINGSKVYLMDYQTKSDLLKSEDTKDQPICHEDFPTLEDQDNPPSDEWTPLDRVDFSSLPPKAEEEYRFNMGVRKTSAIPQQSLDRDRLLSHVSVSWQAPTALDSKLEPESELSPVQVARQPQPLADSAKHKAEKKAGHGHPPYAPPTAKVKAQCVAKRATSDWQVDELANWCALCESGASGLDHEDPRDSPRDEGQSFQAPDVVSWAGLLLEDQLFGGIAKSFLPEGLDSSLPPALPHFVFSEGS